MRRSKLGRPEIAVATERSEIRWHVRSALGEWMYVIYFKRML